MKINKLLLSAAAFAVVAAPALAGQEFDSTTVGPDASLSNGAGVSGPGMSGSGTYGGKNDTRVQIQSISGGRTASYRVKSGFSNRPIYDNNVYLSLPHIR